MHKAFKLYNGTIYDLPGALRNVYWAKCNARRKQKTETQAQGLLRKATIAQKLANPKTMDGSLTFRHEYEKCGFNKFGEFQVL